jgi:hypothetical protein
MTRPDWRGEIGKRGIWLLNRSGARYRANHPFDGFSDEKEHLHEVDRLLANDVRR